MEYWLDTAFASFGKMVFAGGGISIITYQIFKYLGAKWLDSKFEERLQKLKHEHGKEIEGLRLKIGMLLDRAIKSNQREFEVLPLAWDKLNESFYSFQGLALSLHTYPDVDKMDSQQLQEFIDGLDFLPWEKRELQSTSRKSDFYYKQILARKIHETRGKISEAAIYFSRNGVFIKPIILRKMKALNDIVWSAFVEFEMNNRHEGHFKDDRQNTFSEKGGPMLAEIESLVQEHLWQEGLPELSTRPANNEVPVSNPSKPAASA